MSARARDNFNLIIICRCCAQPRVGFFFIYAQVVYKRSSVDVLTAQYIYFLIYCERCGRANDDEGCAWSCHKDHFASRKICIECARPSSTPASRAIRSHIAVIFCWSMRDRFICRAHILRTFKNVRAFLTNKVTHTQAYARKNEVEKKFWKIWYANVRRM